MITVDFIPKTQKLALKAGFQYLDVLRSFPSRRFDPKTKAWLVPLTKLSVAHLQSLDGRVKLEMSAAAVDALLDLEKLTSRPIPTPFPRNWFTSESAFQPLPHQWEMLDKGWGLRGYALFATMGLGKTFVTIQTAAARHAAGEIDRLAIICPATLHNTWEREFTKYDINATTRRAATSDKYLEDWAKRNPRQLHVLLISVEGLGISEKYFNAVLPFFMGARVMAVCDESSRIKSPDAKRTKRAIALADWCAYRTILNGTPMALGIQDLWSQYQFVDPNIIGSGDYWAFKTRYIEMGGYEFKQIVGYKNVDELMEMVRPYSLEMGKGVLNLPDKVYKEIAIEPTTVQRALFKLITHGSGAEGYIKAENVLERMLRLQQVAGGFKPITDIETDETRVEPLEANPKLDALLGIINDHFAGSKFIIWARYVPEIQLIMRELQRLCGSDSVVSYYGETTVDERKEAEYRYCNDPKCRFLVGNPSAAGLGLTLIGGENDVMIYYSGTFAYIDRAQSEDRSHRIGQKNTVTVVDLVMPGTIDALIRKAIAAKTDINNWMKEQLKAGKSLIQLLEEG